MKSVVEQGVMPPPDQLPPTDLPDAVQPVTTRIASLELLESRVTIYTRGLVWDRIQATWVRVFRAPSAQYADAFHIQFKPRRKRLTRQLIDDYKPSTIIIAGWDHPHVRPRILLPSGERTLAPHASSVTVGGPAATDMDRIVDHYIRSLPPADITLDLRGQIVATGRKW
jgi:hypothetical protein